MNIKHVYKIIIYITFITGLASCKKCCAMPAPTQYNYSIFNDQSFLDINSNELKLLYYYFCLATLPGSYMYKFSFNDLLEFWPKSQNRSTIFKRKQLLTDLLDQFCHIQDKILDMKISLEKKANVIVNILVKKKQLKLN